MRRTDPTTARRRERGVIAAAIVAAAIAAVACAPARPEPVKTAPITAATIDPAVWGAVYPAEYDRWQATKEQRPAGKSKYKKGDDGGKVFDKLSEYPFMAQLFSGWGFGVEYNEPRGHWWMLADQLKVDPSRVKAGGVCLTCKTPYVVPLRQELGAALYRMPYLDAVAKIPAKYRRLGVSCIDCHDSKNMGLKVSRWTIIDGVRALGRELPTTTPEGVRYGEEGVGGKADGVVLTHREMRSVVCGQCHCTYIVTKDKDHKSTGVYFPWNGSKWGAVSVENIIKEIKADESHLEWTQAATGFRLGYVRHPEFEFFTNGSVHFNAGVACADCHAPYMVSGPNKITDHDFMSPLKNQFKACLPCHPETPDELRKQVLAIQDKTIGSILNAGLACSQDARLFQLVAEETSKGKSFDPATHAQAKEAYEQAFYRVVFLGAENSVGFHNPAEAGRIAADALAFAGRAEGLLKGMLAKVGVTVPPEADLELGKYANGRGAKKLGFAYDQEFRDPSGVENALWFENLKRLRKRPMP